MHAPKHTGPHQDLLSIKVPGSFWKLTCPQVGRCEPGFALMHKLVGFSVTWDLLRTRTLPLGHAHYALRGTYTNEKVWLGSNKHCGRR